MLSRVLLGLKGLLLVVLFSSFTFLGACGHEEDSDEGGSSTSNTSGGTSSSSPESATPVVSYVSPTEGDVAGGQVITIVGKNFSSISDLKVLFGSIKSPAIRLISDTELEVTVPEGLQPGPVDVTVMSGSKKILTLKDAVTFAGWLPMEVSALSPAGGPVAGGNTISIRGQNLVGSIDVTFGSKVVPHKHIEQVSSMLLRLAVPAGSAGVVNVGLVRGSEVVDAGSYEYGGTPLSIDEISPNSASAAGGEVVNIYGHNFTANTTATIGGKQAASTELVSPTHLRITLPVMQAGEHGITLKDPAKDDYSSLEKLTIILPGEGRGESPYVAGAVSVDAHTVLLSFSEPMGDSVENPDNYQIHADNFTNLIITAVHRQGTKDVLIETLAQTNVNYTAIVAGVTDMEGNALRPEERGSRYDRASFPGNSESAAGGITDTDGDGLPDSAEQHGRVITITRSDGSEEKRVVTSDPYVQDSDDDGFSDLEESTLGTDPRSKDTDQDTLDDFTEYNVIASDPTSQDSDGDGINDWSEVFYKTSLILADSDGDQLSDYQELFDLNLNPLIANLPTFDHAISSVNLGLDVRYTYEDSEGITVERVDTIEENSSTEVIDYSKVSTITYSHGELGGQVTGMACYLRGCPSAPAKDTDFALLSPQGGSVQVQVAGKGYFGSDSTADSGSDTSTLSAYNRSLVQLSNTERNSVTTKEIVAARATVTLNLRLTSAVAMTLRDIEISLFQVSPAPDNPTRLVPVGVLTPASGDLVVNLGPLSPERQGIIFTSDSIFPSQVERLMRSPNLLVARISNYNSTDEFGREFNYTEQEVFNRTASFIIDYANGDIEQALIAVAPSFDPDTGANVGKTVEDAVSAMGLLEYHPDKPLADLDAEGVDINGTYGTQDINGKRVITRVRNRQIDLDNPDRSFWLLAATSETEIGNFQASSIGPRQQYLFILTRDLDGDGLSEYEENLIGTSDLHADTDQDGLTDYLEVRGFPNIDDPGPQWRVAYYNKPIDQGGLRLDYYEVFSDPTSEDTDKDGLTDGFEYDLRQGPPEDGIWKADPGSVDTDIDGALDQGENDGITITLSYTPTAQDLSTTPANQLCPNHVDKDGSTDITKGDECTIPSAINIQDSDGDDFSDGFERIEGLSSNHNDQHHFLDADSDGLRDNEDENDESGDADGDGLPDMLEHYLGTAQLNADSDGDTLGDGVEWLEGVSKVANQTTDSSDLAALRSRCDNALNCTWPSGAGALGTDPLRADSDGDGLHDNLELAGWDVQLDSYDENGQVAAYHVDSDPLDADTDDDGLNDKTESEDPKTDPRNPDTDSDGTPDNEDASGGRSPLKADIVIEIGMSSIRVRGNGAAQHSQGDGDRYNAYWSVVEPVVFSEHSGHSPIVQCKEDRAGFGVLNDTCKAEKDYGTSIAIARAIKYAQDATRIEEKSGDFSFARYSQNPNPPPLPDFEGIHDFGAGFNNQTGANYYCVAEITDNTSNDGHYTTYRFDENGQEILRAAAFPMHFDMSNIFYNGDHYRFDPFQDDPAGLGSAESRLLKSQRLVVGLKENSHISFSAMKYGQLAGNNERCYEAERELIVSYGGPQDQAAQFLGSDLLESGRKFIVISQGVVSQDSSNATTPDIEFVFEVRRVD